MLRCVSLCRRFAEKPSTFDMLQHEFDNNPHWTHAFPEAGRVNPTHAGKAPASNWVESLLQHYTQPRQQEPFRAEDHVKHFIEGFRTPKGPIKWMTAEEKEKVHQTIDAKMVQLEETGLSREEILYNKPGGIPLSFDPVFQLLKNSRMAREMVVKEGAEFTLEAVLDPALHQDFGIDRAKTLPNKDEKYAHEIPSSYENSILARLRPDDRIKSEDYYWRANLQGKLRALQLYSEASTVLFPKPLQSRKALRSWYGRTVNVKDIHIRNPALLAKFMAVTGKIRNRWVTKLPIVVQKKIARTIKQARQIRIFPYISFIQSFHKKPLHGPHHQSSHVYIHSETGIVFANDRIEALQENNKPEESTFMRLLVENYKKEMTEEDLVSK